MHIFVVIGIIFIALKYGLELSLIVLTSVITDLVELQYEDNTGHENFAKRTVCRTASTETQLEWISPNDYHKLKGSLQQAEITAMELRKQLVDVRDANARHVRSTGRTVATETDVMWISGDDHHKLKAKLQQAEVAQMDLRKQLVDFQNSQARLAKDCCSVSVGTDFEWNSPDEHNRLKKKLQLVEKQLSDAQATSERLGYTLTVIANSTHPGITPPVSPPLTLNDQHDVGLSVSAPPPPPLPPMSMTESKSALFLKKPKTPPNSKITETAYPPSMFEVLAELNSKKKPKVNHENWSSPRTKRLNSTHVSSPLRLKSPVRKTDIMKTPSKGSVAGNNSTTPQKSHLPVAHRRRQSYRLLDHVSVQVLAQHRLRKTNIPRSPGGTTLLTQGSRKQTAPTLSEVAADALRKKFAKAFPKDEQCDSEWTDDESTPMKSLQRTSNLQRSKTIS